jgi:hypothetical protein
VVRCAGCGAPQSEWARSCSPPFRWRRDGHHEQLNRERPDRALAIRLLDPRQRERLPADLSIHPRPTVLDRSRRRGEPVVLLNRVGPSLNLHNIADRAYRQSRGSTHPRRNDACEVDRSSRPGEERPSSEPTSLPRVHASLSVTVADRASAIALIDRARNSIGNSEAAGPASAYRQHHGGVRDVKSSGAAASCRGAR